MQRLLKLIKTFPNLWESLKEKTAVLPKWTWETTRLVVSQVLQNARHFAVFSSCCLETEVSKQF
jgi:hypothetical protein